eukprot:gnl/TRDRNA2_/TRDRNA2_160821_c1_seq1.p1 gnl/TRDRNA2_/TRDRNA2_160821_c1~~gnl/TRDRNA2_/TRDRNA2_160821_c1_seq1.p1  ORF type:complete len:213 (+),score=12.52 gnl/TRDRNA2_/TRDRNA2_160821_c1_seq1:45-641(+)
MSFLANIAPSSEKKWLTTVVTALVKELVIGPLGLAVFYATVVTLVAQSPKFVQRNRNHVIHRSAHTHVDTTLDSTPPYTFVAGSGKDAPPPAHAMTTASIKKDARGLPHAMTATSVESARTNKSAATAPPTIPTIEHANTGVSATAASIEVGLSSETPMPGVEGIVHEVAGTHVDMEMERLELPKIVDEGGRAPVIFL